MATLFLDIDCSDVLRLCDQYRSQMSKANFDRMMHRIVQRTGKHVGVVLSKDIPQHYAVKAMQVRRAVGKPSMSGGGSDVSCNIPIRGTRGRIGGMFKATGGAPGWNVRPYRVKAKIVKGNASVIPQKAMGGVAPFRNTIAPRLNNLTFTRQGKDRFPIAAISGIAIPQMPMNRSKEDVEKDIADFMYQQAQHEIQYRIGMIR